MTLTVRDEEELLRANLVYHLERGVDVVFVTDHASKDATPDILEEFRREGQVRAHREDGARWEQGPWQTRMAREAAELGADWVIPGDADEFWWPTRGELVDALGEVPLEVGAVVARRHNFAPRPADGRPFHARMRLRERVGRNLLGFRTAPKVAHRAARDVTVGHGGHRASFGAAIPRLYAGALEILHFPLRSFDDLRRRADYAAGELAAHGTTSPSSPQNRALMQLREQGLLERYWDRLASDERAVRAELEAGLLVPDDRLATWFETRDG